MTLLANNGDQMLGINAIQWGMGGAVVAYPQEAGTVFSNPAGLSRIELKHWRVDAGLGVINPDGNVNGVDSEADLFIVPAGAFAKRVGNGVTLGIGVGGLGGIGVDIPDALPAVPGTQPFFTKKQFLKMAPALSYIYNERLSLGLALHLNRQSITLRNPVLQLPRETAYGYGAALGLVYRFPDRHFQLGANYTTRQHMHRTEWTTPAGDYSARIEAPATLGAGIAWQARDSTLVELDVKKIYFSDTQDQVSFTTPAGPLAIRFGWEDQTVYALGMQQRLDNRITLRGGLNYGRSPIAAEDVDTNIGSLAIPEKHLALGCTYDIDKRFSVSGAVTRAFNNRVTSSSASGTDLEMEQNFLHLQFTYRN